MQDAYMPGSTGTAAILGDTAVMYYLDADDKHKHPIISLSLSSLSPGGS